MKNLQTQESYALPPLTVTTPTTPGGVEAAGRDLYEVSATIREVVVLGTYNASSELVGATPAGSVAGMRFSYLNHEYEFMPGDAGTLAWVRNAKKGGGGTSAQTDLRWSPAMSRAFQSTGQYVEVPGFGNVLPTADLTVEFMMTTPRNTSGMGWDQTHVSVNNDTADNRLNVALYYSTGGHYFDRGDITVSGRQQINVAADFLDQWHHVACIVDASAGFMEIRIDNNYMGRVYQYSPYTQGNTSLYIGTSSSNPPGQLHHGKLSEMRIWNFARQPAEIEQDMNMVLDAGRPGLIGCWRLDDAVSVNQPILDRSGNGYHGILRAI